MKQSFQIQMSSQTSTPSNHAQVAVLGEMAHLRNALQTVGISLVPHPVMVVIGGASYFEPEQNRQIQQLFTDAIAPIAERYQTCVVDGGTDSGVMRLMGSARSHIQGTFPLIGVAPLALVEFPGTSNEHPESSPLEPNHTHFLLTPGNSWGDESHWLAKVASELSGTTPSVAILLNGGNVTWRDALENLRAGQTVIVIDGTGRAADEIAAGLRGEVHNHRVTDLIATGRIEAIPLQDAVQQLTARLETAFQPLSKSK
ncbi:hypothetical protein [Alkalinema sp. FACHB-956]|uniref:hypothetical protein n=1 Tax=Alkalinema sp. FACHB-956 TaxID=2692768 RepID=UPI0016848151|nr:hypothetical protein [Alkalinema sp. FACHB-956]MBD2326208.1 hypothetical protein [Alkalinema sp. FACHB-956]